MGEALSPEEGHERGCEGLDVLIEPFQCVFGAYGIAQQHNHKVNDVVMAKPASGETYPLFNCRQYAYVLKILCDNNYFPEPGRNGRNLLRRSLDCHR
jgi:hypothetical protein